MENIKKAIIKNKINLVVLIIAIIFPQIFSLLGAPLKTSTITLINIGGIYVIAAIGYNILLGYAGQISLGHAAFIGLGAYITANLSTKLNGNFLVSMIASIIVTALLGFVLGLPALRLEGNYLAIATLGFGVAFEHVFMEFEKFTGGFSGMKGIPPIEIFGYEFKSRISMYYFILAFIVISLIIARNILKTKTGRALMALRDSEISANSLGVNTSKYKTIAFVISAAYAGAAGCLWAYLFRQVYPQSFGMGVSLNLLAMIVIGGLASLPGAIMGAMFMTMLPEYMKGIPIENGAAILTGLLLILTVMYCPFGINQIIQKLRYHLGRSLMKKNNTSLRKEG